MIYRVEYKNPNNIILTDKVYVFETRSKAELNKWLQNAHKYSGSYEIISNEKISEAKKKK